MRLPGCRSSPLSTTHATDRLRLALYAFIPHNGLLPVITHYGIILTGALFPVPLSTGLFTTVPSLLSLPAALNAVPPRPDYSLMISCTPSLVRLPKTLSAAPPHPHLGLTITGTLSRRPLSAELFATVPPPQCGITITVLRRATLFPPRWLLGKPGTHPNHRILMFRAHNGWISIPLPLSNSLTTTNPTAHQNMLSLRLPISPWILLFHVLHCLLAPVFPESTSSTSPCTPSPGSGAHISTYSQN